MKRNNFYSQGNSVVWIIIIPVILSSIIVGGGYYYLSKQIPSMPEVASRLSEEKVENKEEAEKAKVEVERLKKEASAAAKLIEELNVQDEQIVVEIEESVDDLIPELTLTPSPTSEPTPLGPPDITISSFTLNKSNYSPGETATATLTIINLGESDSSAFNTHLYSDASSNPECNASGGIDHWTPFNFSPSSFDSWSINFRVAMLEGSYTARIFADMGCAITESNEENNYLAVSYEVLAPALTIPPPRATFSVRPYLVYPADKPMYPAYETAIATYLGEMQQWYLDKVGATFSIHALQIKQSSNDYITMRCGENPTQTCLDDPSKLESNWGAFINKAVHGGIEQWEQQTVALVFSAGGGGYAGGSFQDPANYLGWAIVGDWVLEPISGVANTWGIPCSYSDGWQCAEGQAIGTPAHELGHAFGLGHSPPGSNSIMINVSGYPTIGFLTNEIEYLLASPFFQ